MWYILYDCAQLGINCCVCLVKITKGWRVQRQMAGYGFTKRNLPNLVRLCGRWEDMFQSLCNMSQGPQPRVVPNLVYCFLKRVDLTNQKIARLFFIAINQSIGSQVNSHRNWLVGEIDPATELNRKVGRNAGWCRCSLVELGSYQKCQTFQISRSNPYLRDASKV